MSNLGIFLIGVLVGVALGWLLLSLMIAASRADEQLEREMRGVEDDSRNNNL